MSKRAPTYNHSFFDEWTPELAYVLGCAITDGCLEVADYMVKSGPNKGRVVRQRVFSMQVADRCWLETVKRLTGATRDIETCDRKHGTYYRLRIQGQAIVDSFLSLGVTPRKSMTKEMPAGIPVELFYHFLRGVIDGDGSIIIRGGGESNLPDYVRLDLSIASGSKAFLEGLQAVVGGVVRHSGGQGHSSYKLEMSCSSAADLLNKVYADSDGMRLHRKFAKWQEFLSTGKEYRSAA